VSASFLIEGSCDPQFKDVREALVQNLVVSVNWWKSIGHRRPATLEQLKIFSHLNGKSFPPLIVTLITAPAQPSSSISSTTPLAISSARRIPPVARKSFITFSPSPSATIGVSTSSGQMVFTRMFASLARYPSERVKLPSRPGESHPEPLTDPYVNLSIHTARATL
jgi:hypothetical protein